MRDLLIGQKTGLDRGDADLGATAAATGRTSPVRRIVRMPMAPSEAMTPRASGRTASATTIVPSIAPSRATKISARAGGRRGSDRDTLLGHEGAIAYDDGRAVDHGRDAVAGRVVKRIGFFRRQSLLEA